MTKIIRYKKKKHGTDFHYIYNNSNIIVPPGEIMRLKSCCMITFVFLHFCDRVPIVLSRSIRLRDIRSEIENKSESDLDRNMHM